MNSTARLVYRARLLIRHHSRKMDAQTILGVVPDHDPRELRARSVRADECVFMRI